MRSHRPPGVPCRTALPSLADFSSGARNDLDLPKNRAGRNDDALKCWVVYDELFLMHVPCNELGGVGAWCSGSEDVGKILAMYPCSG